MNIKSSIYLILLLAIITIYGCKKEDPYALKEIYEPVETIASNSDYYLSSSPISEIVFLDDPNNVMLDVILLSNVPIINSTDPKKPIIQKYGISKITYKLYYATRFNANVPKQTENNKISSRKAIILKDKSFIIAGEIALIKK